MSCGSGASHCISRAGKGMREFERAACSAWRGKLRSSAASAGAQPGGSHAARRRPDHPPADNRLREMHADLMRASALELHMQQGVRTETLHQRDSA